MQFETLFAAARAKPVTAALAGCGEFGMSLIAQSRRMEGLTIRAVLDRDVKRVEESLRDAGFSAFLCEDASAGQRASETELIVICRSIDEILALPIEIVVEATGDPEAGSRFALASIDAGRGVAMVSKEAECVVGPLLARKARLAGVPYTLIDGDQPSLLIGLISWARTLGLPVVAAGKSSEYDYVFDAEAGTVTWQGQQVAAPRLSEIWHLEGNCSEPIVEHRAQLLADLPRCTTPDYCEMCLVANATGLVPDRPDFHAPFTRAIELPDLYIPREDGGLLDRYGVLDVFNCLRRTDEPSFAGGVYVVVELADERTGQLFAGKGIPVSRNRRYALIYNPSHLLGVEAPISIVAAARLRHCMVDESYRPVCDLVAKAKTDLPDGHAIEIVGTRHAVPDLEPLLVPAAPARGGNPLPYYMAVGRKLKRGVARGEFITADVVEPAPESMLWRLRADQDALFWSASAKAPG